MKAVVAAFNQEKALVGAFSVIKNLWMELFGALILVQHDVKSETESYQEQWIPDEECNECLQYFVEHGHVDVVLGELGVTAHQRDQRRPAQDDREGREVALRLARQRELLVGDVQNGPCDKGVNEISRDKIIIFEKVSTVLSIKSSCYT